MLRDKLHDFVARITVRFGVITKLLSDTGFVSHFVVVVIVVARSVALKVQQIFLCCRE